MSNEALGCDTQSIEVQAPFNVQSSHDRSHFGYVSSSDAVDLAYGRSPDSPERPEHLGRLASISGCHSAPPSMTPIRATQAISRMRGGSQSQLMLADDHNLWVVKFKNNPQHLNVLANELIATRMAEVIGLSVPNTEIIDVSPWLIESSPQLSIDLGPAGRKMCASGLQFGSQFAGGLMPGQVIDFLPDERLHSVPNLAEFAGMLAFDKWTCNSDNRQAVFRRSARETEYGAVFIDQGSCFCAGEWTFQDAPHRGVFARNSAYSSVTGWDSFEPWLSRIEQFSPDVLWEIAVTAPPEWYFGEQSQLEKLVQTLLHRRSRVRELISQFRQSSHIPFPNWKDKRRAVLPRRCRQWSQEEKTPVARSGCIPNDNRSEPVVNTTGA